MDLLRVIGVLLMLIGGVCATNGAFLIGVLPALVGFAIVCYVNREKRLVAKAAFLAAAQAEQSS